MSKLIAGTAFVLLGGATATGGVLLYQNAQANKDKENYDVELPKDKLEESVHGEGCVTKLFGTQSKFEDNLEDLNGTNFDSSAPDSFFPQNKPTSGCLVVNWDKKAKTADSNTTWSGNFRFLWAVKGEYKGFIVFLVGTSQKANSGDTHKVTWSGKGYVMEAETKDGNITWKPKKKSASQTNASTSKETTDATKFPKAGPALKASDGTSTIPEFWGWITGNADLANITDQNQPTDGTDSSLRAYWDWSGVHKETPGENKKLTDWTKDFETWWNTMFDQTKFKVKDVSGKQEGTWTNRHYKKLPATEGTSK